MLCYEQPFNSFFSLLFHSHSNVGCWCCFYFPFSFFFFFARWLFIVMRTRRFLFIRIVFADANAAVFTYVLNGIYISYSILVNNRQMGIRAPWLLLCLFFFCSLFASFSPWSHCVLFAFAYVWVVPVYIFTHLSVVANVLYTSRRCLSPQCLCLFFSSLCRSQSLLIWFI